MTTVDIVIISAHFCCSCDNKTFKSRVVCPFRFGIISPEQENMFNRHLKSGKRVGIFQLGFILDKLGIIGESGALMAGGFN